MPVKAAVSFSIKLIPFLFFSFSLGWGVKNKELLLLVDSVKSIAQKVPFY